MGKIEREDAMHKIKDDIEHLLNKRNTLEVNCGRLICNKDSCDKCEVEKELRFIESTILSLREKIDNILIECNFWSYTIMGNKKAEILWWKLLGIIFRSLTDAEREQYPNELPDFLIKELIMRRYKRLVCFTNSQISRLAYQVLGVFLMKYGAKMTEQVRNRILKFSSWDDEEDQLINKKDREERRMYLLDFREKVEKYKEGVKIEVPIELLNDIMERNKENLFFERDSINYEIRPQLLY
ncbi:MAG: hypothetical protein ACFFD7_07945 [Candidatus Thorarchaeota archaeon]